MKRKSGFTLIEALVALLVLSIGLLGVASMQLTAVQSGHSAYQRSVATLAAKDAAERLWVALGVSREDCDVLEINHSVITDGIYNWSYVWGKVLPQLTAEPVSLGSGGSLTGGCVINVDWADERFAEEESSFTYYVRLP